MRNKKWMVAMFMTMLVGTASLAPQTAFAATAEKPVGPGYPSEVTRDYQSKATDDVLMRRYNALPLDAKKEVSAAVESLPEGIVKLYQKAQGKIYFRAHDLTYNDKAATEKAGYTDGVYYKHNARIEVLADHDALQKADLTTPIYHEFGHFLYNMTWSKVSDQTRMTATARYESDPSRYTTVEEAFADIYTEYKKGDTNSVHTAFSQDAEAVCSMLAEQEFAPAQS